MNDSVPAHFNISNSKTERYYSQYPEADPHGKDLKEGGAKADAGKSPIFQGALSYFPRAIKAISEVSLVGARKYSWKGWETVPDGINRYSDALARHLLAEAVDGPRDLDSGRLHAEQVAWNSLARLELILREQEQKETACVQFKRTSI